MLSVKRANVFVVEDNPDVRDSLVAVVTSMGHHCHTFDAAEKLLESGDLSLCDCLLVDFNLPGMTGTELLSRIRQDGPLPPSAVYTGQINSRVREAAATLDNLLVIEKGNDITAITTHLRTLLFKTD